MSAAIPGIYSYLLPAYAVFHEDSETFSTLLTEPAACHEDFIAAYERDPALYGKTEGILGKPDLHANSFCVSMFPWTAFTSAACSMSCRMP